MELQEKITQLETEVKKLRGVMGRFFSDEIVEQILNTNDQAVFQGKHAEATILIFDIRNSTGIAETLEPEIFAQLMSDIFTDIMDLIYGNHGSVNKMLGDGLLATFGCPVSYENDAANAAMTALQIMDYLKSFNDVRPKSLPNPLAAGIGIATGKVFSGNIGSVRRMEYTVLGDAVNIASRLESLTKSANSPVLMDGTTCSKLGHRAKTRRLDSQYLKGKDDLIDIYALEELQSDY